MVHTREDGYYSVEEVSSWKIVKAIQELDIKIIDMTAIANSSNTLRANHIAWFGDVENGIQAIFAKEGHFETKLCLGNKNNETCITKDQLDHLLQQQNQNPAPTPVVTPDEPVVEIVPAPEDVQPNAVNIEEVPAQ
jgi:hypothetical protein